MNNRVLALAIGNTDHMSTSSPALLRRFITKAKFRHMEVLLRVAELGSMRRAAEAVGMTQPSISQLIAELEELIETQLFFRHARGVEATEAAHELLPVARRILSALGDGSEMLANRLEKNSGMVRVAASEAGLSGLVHPVLPDFLRRNPRVHLTVTPVAGGDPLALVAEGACDILCIRKPEIVPKGWEFTEVKDDALITACGLTHPLANRGRVERHELGQQKWLMNRIDSVARATFEDMFAAEGWDEATRCNAILHIPELTHLLLSTGDYLGIMPRSVAQPFLDGGTLQQLDCDMTAPLAPLGFVWSGERAGRAVNLFANHLRSIAK